MPRAPSHKPYRIGLAVSGGADSTALLILMAELQRTCGFTAEVLHVDHGLRPDSGADAQFVENLARACGLPCHTLRTHVTRRPRESLEMAARRVRLAFFAEQMRLRKLDAIATGHHADDVAETFIMRLARGAGPDGLAGLKRISHVDGITFIRPLLDLRDADLRTFLRARNQTWREDATNADTSILRNKVRHVILPFLREHLDAHITEHLGKSAAILRGELTLPARTAALPPPRPAETADGYELTIEPVTGFTRRPPSTIGACPAVCELSRAALAGRTLAFRPWEPGARIAPTGMHGRSRKLQDVFVTAKVPPAVRRQLPVLTDAGTGEVLWVPGYRVAESAAVESPTAPAWRLTLRREE